MRRRWGREKRLRDFHLRWHGCRKHMGAKGAGRDHRGWHTKGRYIMAGGTYTGWAEAS